MLVLSTETEEVWKEVGRRKGQCSIANYCRCDRIDIGCEEGSEGKGSL